MGPVEVLGPDVPEKPSLERAVTVRRTCSMQGEKQQIRVATSVWRSTRVECRTLPVSGQRSRSVAATREAEARLTLIAAFADATASQGAGRSRNTGEEQRNTQEMRSAELQGY